MEEKPNPKDLTPEERLFRIIQEGEKAESEDDTLVTSSGKEEGPKPEGAAQGAGGQVTFPNDVLGQDFLAQGQAPATAWTQEDTKAKKARRAMALGISLGGPNLKRFFERYLTLRLVNRSLAVCLVGLLGYAVVGHFSSNEMPNDLFMKRADAMGTAAAGPVQGAPENLLPVESFDRSFDAVVSRNVFRPWTPQAQPKAASPTAVLSPTSSPALAAVLANLKLSGIFIGDQPEALIEATDEKKTYAVAVGTSFKGIKVKEVKADAVILIDDAGAEQELR